MVYELKWIAKKQFCLRIIINTVSLIKRCLSKFCTVVLLS